MGYPSSQVLGPNINNLTQNLDLFGKLFWEIAGPNVTSMDIRLSYKLQPLQLIFVFLFIIL